MSFLKKSAFTLTTRIIMVILGILSSILIARILGPELNGKAALILNAVNLVFMLGNLGLGSAFTFYIANKKYPIGEIISFSFISSAVLGSLMMLVFLGSMKFKETVWAGIPNEMLLFSCWLIPLHILSNNLLRIVMGFNRIYLLNLCQLTKSATYLLFLIVGVWYLQKGVWGVLIAMLFATVFSIVGMLLSIRKEIRLYFSVNTDLFRNCFSYGIKAYLLMLINFLNYRLDLFLLKYFKGNTEVGYYSLAVGIAEMIWMIPDSTIATLFPTIAESKETDRSSVTLATCRWTLITLFFAVIGIVMVSRYAISLLYGDAYLPSYSPLLYLLPGVIVFPVFKLLGVDMAARGHPGYPALASAIGLIINIFLNILIIPIYGGVGAAISTSVSYMFMAYLMTWIFRNDTGYKNSDIFIIKKDEVVMLKKLMLSLYKKILASLYPLR